MSNENESWIGGEALERAIAVVGLTKLADAIGVPYQIVQGWRSKTRKFAVPAEHAAAVSVATNGVVTRQDLRPTDWHRIWRELPGAAARLAADRKAAAKAEA